MSRLIDMKLPVEYFDKDRRNTLEARLATFRVRTGDVIRFHEWDVRQKRYTGRYFDRGVEDFHRIRRATRFWKKTNLAKYGIYILKLGTPRRHHGKRKVIRSVSRF
jgi:hypothetical protein